jgi:hypothetical protein
MFLQDTPLGQRLSKESVVKFHIVEDVFTYRQETFEPLLQLTCPLRPCHLPHRALSFLEYFLESVGG